MFLGKAALDQVFDLAQQAIELHRFALAVGATREGQQVPHHVGASLGAVLDHVDQP